MAFDIPNFVIINKNLNVESTEAPCIKLRKLAYPWRLLDEGEEFKDP